MTASTDRHWLALGVIAAAFFMSVLDSTSVFTALPSIADDLEFSPAGIQWVVTAYGVTVGGLMLFGGRLADLLGRRRVFMAAVAVFAAASLLCGLAWSAEVLIAARTLQGVGAAVLTPAGLSLLMTVFPDGPERHRALGVWGGLGGVGATAGLLLGGVLTDGLGWSWIFFVNVPVCVLVLVLSPALLPESRDRDVPRRFDLAGAVTVTAALALFVYTMFDAAESGRPTARSAVLLAAALALGALFVAVESRSRSPLVPLRIFRSRTLVGGNLVVLVAGLAVDGMLILVTLYAQQVLGFSALQFGLAVAVMTIASVGGVALSQHLVTRTGFGPVALGGMILLGAALLLLTGVSAGGSFTGDLLAGLLVFGLGMGGAFVSSQIAALAGVAESESGLASGLEETSFTIGSTLGVATLTAVAVARADDLVAGGTEPLAALTSGVQTGFLVAAGFTVLGALAAITLLWRRTPEPATTEPQRAPSAA
ncbi:MFS transporter [Jiangella rhizosphaerae]|uniref:MFS transporter n=1 Tax=Jiangella rhizosphaerae TaxID=2293569 RepID=A0A418KGV5_9ACTN|nr:MFS transporter [Jiangella rhizosphaerae]RIQ11185.1 MFS transporter [Jiangella rhizosphaerae]